MQWRYRDLQLHSAITRRCDYAEACKELRGVVRAAYVNAPKALQGVIYNDILHAFQTMSGMDTSQHLIAARELLQTAEDILPKQRRTSAAHGYKTAAITWHRRHKNPEPQADSVQLSEDSLVYIFGFLDACSLATASAVCKAWNVAANEDSLWRAQFLSLSLAPDLNSKILSLVGIREGDDWQGRSDNTGQLVQNQVDKPIGLWRKAFDLARQGRVSRVFMSNRVFCPQCKGILWLPESKLKPMESKCVVKKQILDHHSLRPMSVDQVVRYVVHADLPNSSASSSSDSDEDEEEGQSFFRLWNVRKLDNNIVDREFSAY
ncbi:hypothetical protein BDL97_04G021300 [Sphagnum fallax]|nr:hypothetical protein BDL97_04G021300 [Sphagnum fallax]KAH8963589.1 hypothetical protein BDL97_04G021300 [Sphagnum fallax]